MKLSVLGYFTTFTPKIVKAHSHFLNRSGQVLRRAQDYKPSIFSNPSVCEETFSNSPALAPLTSFPSARAAYHISIYDMFNRVGPYLQGGTL